jgi:hypothetical protein
MPKYVSFTEYQAAKNEIIGGVEYMETSELNQYGAISKQYGTENNGTFFQVTENGITEFWSTKESASRYYDGRTREEIIAHYEKRIAAAEKEAEAEKSKIARDNASRFMATEYKGRVFPIYEEIKDPYSNQKPGSSHRGGLWYGKELENEIELAGASYIGGDLYVIPMQVYRSENPALLKVVFLVADLSYTERLGGTFAEITGNNIRTAYMTLDKKLFYHSGAGDAGSGEWDLTPVTPERWAEMQKDQ